ncbi:FAD-dependent thymidylate synthase [Paenibacillus kribbensis]|uniref:FAD-dependent thymidylate synthase n=1 Tax=Paenibacillus kribbensis TaxID=172713 RepID=UPI001FC95DC6|nr:FAD-dependent thymidylate synthase [Paenibacillus kribbensis]
MLHTKFGKQRKSSTLQAVSHFLNQRIAYDAQQEIQEYAKAVLELFKNAYPNALNELKNRTSRTRTKWTEWCCTSDSVRLCARITTILA